MHETPNLYVESVCSTYALGFCFSDDLDPFLRSSEIFIP